MSDDRDNRRPKTPLPAVAAQLAAPESWDQQHTGVTPVHGVPVVADEGPVQTLVRRSAQTKNMVIDVQGEVAQLGTRVGALETAVKVQGEQNATIIGLTGDVISILKGRETVTTTTQLAQVEVTKTRALTENELSRERGLVEIEDAKATKALRREWAKKTFERFALPILAAIATYVVVRLTNCGA